MLAECLKYLSVRLMTDVDEAPGWPRAHMAALLVGARAGLDGARLGSIAVVLVVAVAAGVPPHRRSRPD